MNIVWALAFCGLVGTSAWFLRAEAARHGRRVSEQEQRLSVAHDRFVAEMRLQQMTHAGLQQLFDEARRAR